MSDPDVNDLSTCDKCGETMIVNDYGTYKGKLWQEYLCMKCGNWFTEEPDYE